MPTKFPRDFQEKQTTAAYQCKNQHATNGVWLVILFLSRKKFHAKQIFVLSSAMKLGPVDSINIIRNGALWCTCNIISHSNIKRFQAWSLFLQGIWKHTNLCNKGVFIFSRPVSCTFDNQLSPNFKKTVILWICLDTPRENSQFYIYMYI